VRFAKPLTSKAGTTYWIVETPQCTNSSDSNCSVAQYYVDNTTQETNGVNASAQVPNQIYWNSVFFGTTFNNWCDSQFGQNSEQCARLSIGVTK
jgi:hypothetical protein